MVTMKINGVGINVNRIDDSSMNDHKTIYFDSTKLSIPQEKYVCWLDIMGTKNIMSESVQKSANFIFKLHIALIEALKECEEISLYPMMDGAYILSSSKIDISKFLTIALSRLAVNFSEEKEDRHRFLVRGALAFGAVYEGKHMDNRANLILREFENYKGNLILGMPIIQAFNNEKKAPPFSIYICESARAFAPRNDGVFKTKWFRWQYQNEVNKDFDYNKFVETGEKYFEYAALNAFELEYEKSEEHKSMFKECFMLEHNL